MKRVIKELKRKTLRAFNAACWPIYIAKYKKMVLAGKTPPEDLLKCLVYHWGNAGFSADHRYLMRLIIEVLRGENLTILECGSGLSTLLLGMVADHRSHRLVALEHHPAWRERVQTVLKKEDVQNVEVFYCPLRDYGTFDWYDIKRCNLAESTAFDIVICDGPPAQTRGGRLGLPYIMKNHLSQDCLILADDTHRPSEQRILARWLSDFQLQVDEARSENHFKALMYQARSTELPSERD